MRDGRGLRFLGVSLLCAGLIGLAAIPAGAAAKHPIDAAYDRAVAADSSTAGMVDAAVDARKRWDADMNRVYGLLMKKLDPGTGTLLRDAQRAWIRYRDAELAANAGIVDWEYRQAGGGTIWSVVQAGRAMEITRTRALELEAYLKGEGE
jgi:uncharacterized protein YecT (DUF1311 family)